MKSSALNHSYSRRDVIKLTGIAGAALAGSALFAGCSSSGGSASASASAASASASGSASAASARASASAASLTGSQLNIYCGAGMTDPFTEIAEAFEKATGCKMNVTFANAAQIQTQIDTTKEGDFFSDASNVLEFETVLVNGSVEEEAEEETEPEADKAARTIVAGGRDYSDKVTAFRVLDSIVKAGDVIISGHATGADTLGEQYAKEHGLSCELHPADWNRHGRAAGPIRNEEMAKVADRLVAFWDGKSSGTKSMISLAKKYKLEVLVFDYAGNRIDEDSSEVVAASYTPATTDIKTIVVSDDNEEEDVDGGAWDYSYDDEDEYVG